MTFAAGIGRKTPGEPVQLAMKRAAMPLRLKARYMMESTVLRAESTPGRVY